MPRRTKNTRKPRVSGISTASLTTLVPKFPGDPVLQISVPGLQIPLPAPTSNVSAVSSAISAAQIEGFTARFAPMWNEYRIIKVKYDFRAVGNNLSTGLVVCWFEANTNSAVPAYADSVDNHGIHISTCDVLRKHMLTYKPLDVADLNYRTTAGAQIIGYLNMYSDLVNYGLQDSASASAPIIVAMPLYTIQFRGFA